MPEATSAKICVKCGTDCSGKPRTKDGQGRYTCKACFDAAAKAAKPVAKPAPKPAPAAAPEPDDAAIMASLLESSPSSLTEMCPSCGSGMSQGAVICTICGYNKQTGRAASVKVDKGPSKAATMALGAASAVGGLAAGPMALILAIVGASVGGLIGAGVWAFIVYQFQVESGWIAWGIGALVGVGAAMGARGYAGATTGIAAAVIALLAVFGGRYAAISMIAEDVTRRSHGQLITITEEDMISFSARDVAKEMSAAGKNFQWPEGVEQEHERGEEEFPPQVWAEAKKRWEAIDPAEREKKTAQRQSQMNARTKEAIKSIGFMSSFSLIDLLWVFLAAASAFRIGSGLNSSGGGD